MNVCLLVLPILSAGPCRATPAGPADLDQSMFEAPCPNFLRLPPSLVGAARPRTFHDLPPVCVTPLHRRCSWVGALLANHVSGPTVDRCHRLVPQGQDAQLAPRRMSGEFSFSKPFHPRSLISDVATVDCLLLNMLPTPSSCVSVYSIASSRILNVSVPNTQSSTIVVALRCLVPADSDPPSTQGSDACYLDKSGAASLDDTMHSFPRFTTRLPFDERVVSKWKTTMAWSFHPRSRTPIFPIIGKTMSKNLDESFAAVASPSSSPYNANITVHTHSWMRCSGMPPATDLGHNVFAPPDAVNEARPCHKKLYGKHVTVIGRSSNGAGICFASFGINTKAAELTAAGHAESLINCSSVLLYHVSHRFEHLSCYLFPFRPCPPVRASGFLCIFAPQAFISLIIWSICSSPNSIFCRVSHRWR